MNQEAQGNQVAMGDFCGMCLLTLYLLSTTEKHVMFGTVRQNGIETVDDWDCQYLKSIEILSVNLFTHTL